MKGFWPELFQPNLRFVSLIMSRSLLQNLGRYPANVIQTYKDPFRCNPQILFFFSSSHLNIIPTSICLWRHYTFNVELAKKSCATAAAGAYGAVVPNGSSGSHKFCYLAAVGSSWGCLACGISKSTHYPCNPILCQFFRHLIQSFLPWDWQKTAPKTPDRQVPILVVGGSAEGS